MLWQYWLWSFKSEDTKLVRVWPIRMNALVQTKLYYLSKRNDCKLLKSGIFAFQNLNFYKNMS